MVGRAAIKIYGSDQYYFFYGPKYVRTNWIPGQSDIIIDGPAQITLHWKSLSNAGFAHVDAILPIPDRVCEAYVFSGSQFCRIRYLIDQNDDELLTPPSSIAGNWTSLANVGFDHIDAAMIVPGTTDQAYFFNGSMCCRVSFSAASDQPDELLQGPFDIQERWGKLGFQTIDMVIASPYTSLCTFTNAYVLSGSSAARINLVPGGDVDVLDGPADMGMFWPAVCGAFY